MKRSDQLYSKKTGYDKPNYLRGGPAQTRIIGGTAARPKNIMTIKKQAWIQIAVYFVIATALSGVFRFGLFGWYNNMSLPFGLTFLVKTLLEGIGPIAGALVILTIVNKKSSITLLGTQPKKSLIMAIVPVLLFTFFGANNDLNLNRHYYGFIIGIATVIYGIFEEYGWRGFLHNELIELKRLHKSLIIGVIWYVWHLSFISQSTTLLNELIFFGIIVFGSWGIGVIAEKTKSIIACACFHILGNILFLSPQIATTMNNQARYIIFGICLIAWIYIVNIWHKKSADISTGALPKTGACLHDAK
ncbi:MAG: CPBP family intramembrane metalloprotease [Candidatus Edwardsbacteria bacterium]|nr:CPBP family intramembrane metalloprotease [Candidatus Edwardsbacteria bacterium]MBU1577068.1 CPBP family intramembrane metalloprotease [Candidatus Edwardsbacteria bacterium]MBU2483197.1 CPBP family intramembrane metalloprotease [Pseudomonadota bacterium]MBU2594736.1 CPBP family intramembrane metalloprotease [Candidatus Edwardsbacteria bacterium]